MQKTIKFTKKKMLKALLCTAFMPSFALAADKDEITDFSPAASSKIIQQKSKLEHDIDQGILTTLTYYQSTYPQSDYGTLSKEKTQKLLLLATRLKHEKSLDAGTALKQTLNELLLTSTPPIAITNVKRDTPQQPLIDPEILTILTYYQSAYPNSDFAKLDAEQSNKLRLLATRLKHEKGLDASTALKQALKIVNQITDRDAFEIIQDSGFSTKTITKPQAQELEAKIVGTLKKLYSTSLKSKEFLFPKTAVTERLKRAPQKTLEAALIILNQIDTEAMPSKVLNIQDVEENLKAQKIATAIIVAQQQLDNETDQVMKESEESISARASRIVAESIHQNSSLALQKQQLINDKIRALRISTDIKGKISKEISYFHADNDEKNKLFEERVKVVRGMIREILEKIQDGTIPNLTGQSPVPNIISFLEPTTTFEEILTKLNSVGNDKGTALFAQRVARKDIGTTDQIPLSAVTIDTIDDNDILIRSASVKSTPPFGSILTKTVEVQSLVASTKSGFVAKALPENSNQSTVILKAFIMDGTDRNAGYASFTILSSNVKKLEELQEKGYSFWSINNNFFAIPLDPSLHVKSLSQNKQALSGQIVTNINIVIKGNRPVTD